MAFRLKGTKSVGAQLSRVVSKELRKAAADVGELKERTQPGGKSSIHDARKHLKKIRAVLRLLRTELGDDYTPLNRRIRSAAHRLSPLRDADALFEVMEMLRAGYPRVITLPVFAAAKNALAAERRAAQAKLLGRQIADVTHRLAESKGSMPSRIRRVATARTMRDGIGRGYRRARRAMADIEARTEDVQFHAWRRRVKDHWYHMRLVEGLNRRVHSRVRRLKQLETWLGDDHNLVVLRSVILKTPRRFGDEKTVALILGCIDKHQVRLRRRAIKRGHRLFLRDTKSFRKRISHWWNG